MKKHQEHLFNAQHELKKAIDASKLNSKFMKTSMFVIFNNDAERLEFIEYKVKLVIIELEKYLNEYRNR